MLKIGLTGGIGAGKTTVAQLFRERGVPVVDADAVAREVVEPGTPALGQITARFGADLVDAGGHLDRAVLAQRAFATERDTADLNGIMHPAIANRARELFAQYADALMVVHDVPLLVENNMAPDYHLSIVVDVPAETRVARLVASRGLAESDARARIARQASDAQRLDVCDIALENSGTVADLGHEFATVFTSRLAPFADNLRLGLAAPLSTAVVAYRQAWTGEAARACARLDRACAARAIAVSSIRHVGPTARPGHRAPDIIDVEIRLGHPDRKSVV